MQYRTWCAPLAVACLAGSVEAQVRFATEVTEFVQGGGGGIFVTDNILGGPRGGGLNTGSLDVLSLGTGGHVTLGFDVVITDGPGADFSVFENPFLAGTTSFSEVAAVEVSSNGSDFVRFPIRYAGPDLSVPGSGTLGIGSYSGVSGSIPVLANVDSNSLDPFDPVESGGEAFDLAELAEHPDVVAGTVDLNAIEHVRLVDLVSGASTDVNGTTIWDNGDPTSGSDFDAVAVLNHTGNATSGQPRIDLWFDELDVLHFVIGDPNGFFDLDFSTWRASFDLFPLPITIFFGGGFQITDFSPTEVHFQSAGPVTGTGIQAALSVSIRDLGGEFSGDQVVIQG